MDISGLVSYDLSSRTVTDAVSRGMMTAPPDAGIGPYSQSAVRNIMPFPQSNYGYGQAQSTSYQHVPLSYGGGYPQNAASYTMSSGQSYPVCPVPSRVGRDVFSRGQRGTIVKLEEDAATCRPLSNQYDDRQRSLMPDEDAANAHGLNNEASFSTDIDTLMKAIQSKPQSTPSPCAAFEATQNNTDNILTRGAYPLEYEVFSSGNSGNSGTSAGAEGHPQFSLEGDKGKKKYECDFEACGKGFYQKTHLEIHKRAHTGIKPFVCKESDCGQRFSQLGNLKTHERRHTGERPYPCEICGKSFAQRGNVRAHKIVHEDNKPFTCRLEDCGKKFTQLGNLKGKSHQNKFHTATLKHLTQRFASMQGGDPMSHADRDLWTYFASLYKNSNKGIKGRGKDRKIAGSSASVKSEAGYNARASGSPSSSRSYQSQHDGTDFHASELEAADSNPAGTAYDHRAQTLGYDHTNARYGFQGRKLF
ncbi:MAG: hypothetical protein M1833_005961 [Piccolia ochrophora]|nr:MAG: hypothetical protein M1833_005961 [Piccolia ochrophora]